MAATTQANVLIIAPELSSVAAGTWTLILADVAAEVSSSIYGADQERAQRYLAAHYLTLAQASSVGGSTSGDVISETVGQVSKTYAHGTYVSTSRYGATGYGQTFEQIRKRHVIGFTVITP